MPSLPDALRWAIDEIEAGLDTIDFPEVTREDRVTFLEAAAEWYARRAARRGRGGVLVPLRAFVARRRREIMRGQCGTYGPGAGSSGATLRVASRESPRPGR